MAEDRAPRKLARSLPDVVSLLLFTPAHARLLRVATAYARYDVTETSPGPRNARIYSRSLL